MIKSGKNCTNHSIELFRWRTMALLISVQLLSPHNTHDIPINNRKSWHAFFKLLASSLFILFNLYWRITLVYIEQAWYVTRKWNQKASFKAKRGHFLNRFTGKNQFLFQESKLFYHGIQYTIKWRHSHWKVRQIMKIAHFSVKSLVTLTCRNSLINLVTTKFSFEISVRVKNETGCGSLTDQWR